MTLLALHNKDPLCMEAHSNSAFGEPAEYICQRCGGMTCQAHTVECFYCHHMQRPAWFCKRCAGVHEVTRQYRGGCIDEFRNEWGGERNHKAMQQRRAEKYRQMGLL